MDLLDQLHQPPFDRHQHRAEFVAALHQLAQPVVCDLDPGL
jgi:hypothetical protein